MISLCRRPRRVRVPPPATSSASSWPRALRVSPAAGDRAAAGDSGSSSASWDSAARATACTNAREWGWARPSPPVMSTAPSTRPVRGSRTGAAAQVQEWTRRLKCSAPKTWTGSPTTTAVPGALVPITDSDQRAPGTKPSRSARRSVADSPSTQSRLPRASHTASRCEPCAANAPTRSRNSGITRASGCCARYDRRSASARSTRGVHSGLTRARAQRRQDLAITARTGASTRPSRVNEVCARRRTRVRSAGSAPSGSATGGSSMSPSRGPAVPGAPHGRPGPGPRQAPHRPSEAPPVGAGCRPPGTRRRAGALWEVVGRSGR